MKRFWKAATAVRENAGWVISLDGKPISTPGRTRLVVPSGALGEAIAQEWDSVEEGLDPRALPMTGLASAAIDRIAPARPVFAAGIAKYGESDLAYYRAEGPVGLVERQAESWDSLLAWARRRFDVDFRTTEGIMPVPQPAATVGQLSHAVASLDEFHLAGLSQLVTIGGSLIAGLAVLERTLSPEEAWEAATVDDRWQLEKWGPDTEAELALGNRRRDFFAAARFLELLEG